MSKNKNKKDGSKSGHYTEKVGQVKLNMTFEQAMKLALSTPKPKKEGKKK
jgi:hypothetical protein